MFLHITYLFTKRINLFKTRAWNEVVHTINWVDSKIISLIYIINLIIRDNIASKGCYFQMNKLMQRLKMKHIMFVYMRDNLHMYIKMVFRWRLLGLRYRIILHFKSKYYHTYIPPYSLQNQINVSLCIIHIWFGQTN